MHKDNLSLVPDRHIYARPNWLRNTANLVPHIKMEVAESVFYITSIAVIPDKRRSFREMEKSTYS